MAQLAWIGIGKMGRGMCTNLVAKADLTHPLILYNRTQSRSSDLCSSLPPGKSLVASSVSEATARADIIFMCLSDDAAVIAAVNEVIAAQGGVQAKLIIDCSTIHPDTTTLLAKRIGDSGAGFVAAPVFGMSSLADAGQLVFVLAGPSRLVENVKPYTTEVMGRAIIDLSGEEHSKATHLKIIGNSFMFSLIEAVAQTHVLSERSGLGAGLAHKFLETMFPGPAAAYSTRMTSGPYYKREPLVTVDLARKDVRHALGLAKDSGSQMSILELVDQHLVQVKERMGDEGDLAGIYGAARIQNGLPFEN